MPSATKTRTVSDQQLTELLALTKGADSVELKLTVPVSDRSPAAAALGVDPLAAQIRQVYFFDTPSSSCARSSPNSSRQSCAVHAASVSKSMRCQAGSSARDR